MEGARQGHCQLSEKTVLTNQNVIFITAKADFQQKKYTFTCTCAQWLCDGILEVLWAGVAQLGTEVYSTRVVELI